LKLQGIHLKYAEDMAAENMTARSNPIIPWVNLLTQNLEKRYNRGSCVLAPGIAPQQW